MKCEPGQHKYKPFPRSRDLFCEYCGDEPTRAYSRPVEPRADLAAPPAAATQTELPLDGDPHGDAARIILDQRRQQNAEQRARAHFEAEVRRIVGESDMDADQAEEFVRDALDFGVQLDLNKFQELVGAHQRANPAHGDDAADLIED